MLKRIITIFLIGVGVILVNPINLAASDFFAAKLPNYRAAEQLIVERKNINLASKLTENTDKNGGVTEEISSVWTGMAETASPFEARSVGAPAAGSLAALKEYNQMSSNLSGGDIYRFKHLLFAHNTGNLFGNLSSLSVGQLIAISDGATTTDFRVAEVGLYNKANGVLNGDPQFINKLAAHAMGHDLALMTCAGTPLGGGDATQRLVVYVDAV